ncbi:MAG TPA: peptide-binding protein [Rhodobacteraceae bacterium]|nr:peptide-binding protein [Paracoccaceae bacterium]
MKPLRLVFALLLALGTPVWAQNYPALHDVTGVSPDDVLNVRAAPDAGAVKLDTLTPDATGIEVVAEQDGWGLINTGERSGWASLRHLERRDKGTYPLSRHLSCAGTEPFWSLDIDQAGGAVFTVPAGTDQHFETKSLVPAEGRTDRFALLGPDATLTGTLHRMRCSDGMSDRAYGLDIDLVIRDTEGRRVLAGCCTLQAN